MTPTKQQLRHFLCREDVVAILTDEQKPGVLWIENIEPATIEDVLESHLEGDDKIGSYCPNPDGLTSYACIDIDGPSHGQADDVEERAAAVVGRMDEMGGQIHPIFEVSSSGDGLHIWVVFEELVQAADVRQWMASVVPADMKGVDLYPKQDGGVELGNFVWLPRTFLNEFGFSKLPSTEPFDLTVEALTYLDPDMEYDGWVKVLMALKNSFGDEGYELAKEWSSVGDKYDGDVAFDRKWESFAQLETGVSYKSILKMAQAEGYWIPGGGIESRTTYSSTPEPPIHSTSAEVEMAHWVSWYLESIYPDIIGAEGSLWAYEGRYWKELDLDTVRAAIRQLEGKYTAAEKPARICLTAARISGVRKCLYSLYRVADVWPEGSKGVSFENGFLGHVGLERHNPTQYCRHFVEGVEFDFDAVNEDWISFLETTFKGASDKEERIACLQEAVGCSLMGEGTRTQEVVFLYGVAQTGKGTFLKTVEAMFPSVSLIQPQDLVQQRKTVGLVGSNVNIVYDVSNLKFHDTAAFKQVVEGATIRTRKLFQEEFSFTPTAGWLVGGNILPKTSDVTNGFWRRWVLVLFENPVLAEDKVVGLEQKLKANMPGLYAWAYQGFVRMQNRANYTRPPSSEEVMDDWKSSTDYTFEFASAVLGPCSTTEDGTPTSEIHQAYKVWCIRQGVPSKDVLTQRQLTVQLKELGFSYKKTNKNRFFKVKIKK